MNHTSQGFDRKRIRALVATLIPALNSCKPRMTTGERRLGERLEAKLEDDYLLWYDVAIGGQGSHPDFIVLHPRRGILILEVKNWKLETIQIYFLL